MRIDDQDEELFCPDCGGEVAASSDGWLCVEHSGYLIGCGWSCTYEEERLRISYPLARTPQEPGR